MLFEKIIFRIENANTQCCRITNVAGRENQSYLSVNRCHEKLSLPETVVAAHIKHFSYNPIWIIDM